MDFYAVLPSNSCPETQPNNTASSFYVDFENKINFEGDWEVALTEYNFNYFPASIPMELKMTYFNYGNTLEPVKLSIRNDKLSYKINDPASVPLLNFKLTDDFKLVVNCKGAPFRIKFENWKVALDWGFNTTITHSETSKLISTQPIDLASLKESETDVTVIFKIGSASPSEIIFYNYMRLSSNEKIREYFLEHCDFIFEEFKINQNGLVNFKLKPEIVKVKFDKLLAFDLGFDETEFTNSAIAKRKPRIDKAFSQYFIYSSIVEPILVGESRVPLIRSIWIDPKYEVGDVVYDNVDHPMYIPVAQQSINNIEVQIRTDSGALVNFPRGSKSSITLHFRKNG